VQVGLHFVNFTLPGGPEELAPAATAKAAEEAGVSYFSLMDGKGPT
jgi:hypothetical protein